MAQVGRERIEETIDPELTIERALETYLKKGYSREWINQRLQAIQVRKELTDEWDARGVQKGIEYAILTDEISRAWSGMSTRQYMIHRDSGSITIFGKDNRSDLKSLKQDIGVVLDDVGIPECLTAKQVEKIMHCFGNYQKDVTVAFGRDREENGFEANATRRNLSKW